LLYYKLTDDNLLHPDALLWQGRQTEHAVLRVVAKRNM
jgi:hypothetical protein